MLGGLLVPTLVSGFHLFKPPPPPPFRFGIEKNKICKAIPHTLDGALVLLTVFVLNKAVSECECVHAGCPKK